MVDSNLDIPQEANFFALRTSMIIHQSSYAELRKIENIKERNFPDLPLATNDFQIVN